MPKRRGRIRVERVLFDKKEFRSQVARQGFKPIQKKFVEPYARFAIEDVKRQVVRDYLEHEISKEITRGPYADNSSGTLNGYGNLFSFIGFQAGSLGGVGDPVGIVAAVLSDLIQFRSVTKGKKIGLLQYNVKILIPTLEDLRQYAPIPWEEGGRSWVEAMEQGLSGLGSYLYEDDGSLEDWSRSDVAIQIKGSVKGWNFNPQQYVTPILEKILPKMVDAIKEATIKLPSTI